MTDENSALRLSAQRALLGHVPPCLRSASIQKTGDTIHWRCIFDSVATEDDFELARIAGTEIVADFSDIINFSEEIVVTPFPDSCADLEHLIFFRHEHNYYQEES